MDNERGIMDSQQARASELVERIGTDRERLLAWAERAQRMAGVAHRRGDFIACSSHLETARRYRDLAYKRAA